MPGDSCTNTIGEITALPAWRRRAHLLDQSFNLGDAVFERIVLRLQVVVLRLQFLDGLNGQQRQLGVVDLP